MFITRCRVCHGRDLDPVLDLGATPLANRFLRPEEAGLPEPTYPLRVLLCRGCGLVQLDVDVPREALFREYLYVTGTSDAVHRHAAELAEGLSTRYALKPGDLVLEAASNDGSVLRAFQGRGLRVLGVEPSVNVSALARGRGVETVCAFFDDALARGLRAVHGRARLVLARHVLAHVSDLHGFVRGIKEALAPDGVAVVETPHLAELYRRLEFDTIYHEHLCYYSATVLRTLFRRFGLELVDVRRTPLHGGSLLAHAAHAGGPFAVSERVAAVLGEEETLCLAQPATWHGFATRVGRLRQAIPAFLSALQGRGLRLAGYGAPAKGNTLLNACAVGPDLLPYLVDKNPLKQGLLSPGRRLPVHGVERLLEDRPDVTLLLAWNFADEVLAQQAEYRRRGGRFAVPIPVPQLLGAVPWSKAS